MSCESVYLMDSKMQDPRWDANEIEGCEVDCTTMAGEKCNGRCSRRSGVRTISRSRMVRVSDAEKQENKITR